MLPVPEREPSRNWTRKPTRRRADRPRVSPATVPADLKLDISTLLQQLRLGSVTYYGICREGEQFTSATARLRVIHGDGAAWVRCIAAKDYPVIPSVDPWSAKEHFKDLAKALFRVDPEVRRAWASARRDDLESNEAVSTDCCLRCGTIPAKARRQASAPTTSTKAAPDSHSSPPALAAPVSARHAWGQLQECRRRASEHTLQVTTNKGLI